MMEQWIGPIISGLTVAGTILGGALLFGWKARDWLAGQFTETRKIFHEKIDAHEKIDQARHEENLQRFSDIRVELAQRGRPNGRGHHLQSR